MDTTSGVERFISWLTFHPSLEKIARALVLDYLSIFNPVQAMIYHLRRDDSIVCLASYGHSNPVARDSIPSSSWRGTPEDVSTHLPASPRKKLNWSDANKQVVINLYAQGMLIGFMLIRFANPMVELEDFSVEAVELCWSLSLYYSLQFLEKFEDDDSSLNGMLETSVKQSRNTPALTARQNSILSGMVEKRTNHEIAKDMGYSVSTIRHEAMKIYEALGVSDRVEAAHKAIALGLV